MPPLPYGDAARDQLVFISHCVNGDIDEVRSFLANYRAYPHYCHPYNGWTALHYAANCGHARIVSELVEAGFEREAQGYCTEVPYDVACADRIEDLTHLLSLLHFEGNVEYRPMPGEAVDTAPSSLASSRRGSLTSEGYTPPFTSRPPPFPETMTRKPLPISASRSSTSFDFTSGPGSPVHSPSSPSYSYGRRDSLYRTRFLLVRTSHGGGKEAYTRVTLPGGSGVEQLKRTIEKAMKGRRVDAVFALPEEKLIEFDDQICLFANSQRVAVLFAEGDPTPEPVGDAIPSPTARKASCPDVSRASTSYSTHPSLSQTVSMDAPTTIREGSPAEVAAAAENATDFLSSVLDESIKDASLVEIPSETKEAPEEIDYSIVDRKEEEEEEEEVKEEEEVVHEDVKSEEVKVKEQDKEEEEEAAPKEPTPTPPVTPASPTLRTIPVQKSEEEEEEEEEEEIVEKSRPLVIRKTTSSEEKREEPEEPKKVESVRSDSVGGFEEVSRDDVVEATKEEPEEMVKEEKQAQPKEEEPSSTTNGHPAAAAVPKVVLTKADSSSSPFVDFINEHPELVRQLIVVGVVGAACGVAYMVMRKHR